MSWADSVQSELVIKCGDGNQYTPLWKNSCAKEIEYNIAQFDFPKVQGSKIDRGTPTARKFSLEIYFQGDDHLTTSLNFEISARDPRPWRISHPIYGAILVQPVSLKFDYSGFNTTQITGTILETLGSAGLKIGIRPEDKISADKKALDETIVKSFNAEMELVYATGFKPDFTRKHFPSQQVSLNGINKTIYDIGAKKTKLTEDAGAYLNKYNAANDSVNQGLSNVTSMMGSIQEVINFPSQMINTVKVRVSVIQAQFNALRQNLTGLDRIDKVNYEKINGTLVSSMTTNAIKDTGYKTKKEVLDQINNIQDMRNTYLGDLDGLQTSNNGTAGSYIPNSDVITGLNDLIDFTIANLYNIALTAKQERVIILEADSNAIILAHRFYGLLVDDSTIQQFMDNNNIFLNEILQISKGRTLSFYI